MSTGVLHGLASLFQHPDHGLEAVLLFLVAGQGHVGRVGAEDARVHPVGQLNVVKRRGLAAQRRMGGVVDLNVRLGRAQLLDERPLVGLDGAAREQDLHIHAALHQEQGQLERAAVDGAAHGSGLAAQGFEQRLGLLARGPLTGVHVQFAAHGLADAGVLLPDGREPVGGGREAGGDAHVALQLAGQSVGQGVQDHRGPAVGHAGERRQVRTQGNLDDLVHAHLAQHLVQLALVGQGHEGPQQVDHAVVRLAGLVLEEVEKRRIGRGEGRLLEADGDGGHGPEDDPLARGRLKPVDDPVKSVPRM